MTRGQKKRQHSNSQTPICKKPNLTSEEMTSEVSKSQLDLILEKLQCLPEIQKEITEVRKDIADVKKSLEYTQGELDTIKETVAENVSKIKIMESSILDLQAIRDENKKLRADLESLDAYGRRENLVFSNINESDDENCTSLILKLFTSNLGIDQSAAAYINFQRVHRLGGKRKDGKPRDIIARFCLYPDREKVWNLRYKLKGTPIIIQEDFPPAMARRRRTLFPLFKRAKELKLDARLVKDRLIIAQKMYSIESVHEIAEQLKMREISEKITDTHHLFFGRFSPLSNFHPSPFQIKGMKFTCVEQYIQWQKATYANDPEVASKIISSQNPSDMKHHGDGLHVKKKEWMESHATRATMEALKAKFQQNSHLQAILMQTTKAIAESTADGTWGTGIPLYRPAATDPSKWTGNNLLGKCLTEVRQILSRESASV